MSGHENVQLPNWEREEGARREHMLKAELDWYKARERYWKDELENLADRIRSGEVVYIPRKGGGSAVYIGEVPNPRASDSPNTERESE